MGRRGFTLIELILAIALVAVVLLVALSSLRFGTRLWESGYRAADNGWVKRYFISNFQSDIASAFPYRIEDRILFEGTPARMVFVSANGAANGPPWGGTRLVEYAVEDGWLVVKEEVLPRAQEDGIKRTTELSEQIEEIRFSFLGSSGWIETWDGASKDELPKAVKAVIISKQDKTETVLTIPIMAGHERD